MTDMQPVIDAIKGLAVVDEVQGKTGTTTRGRSMPSSRKARDCRTLARYSKPCGQRRGG